MQGIDIRIRLATRWLATVGLVGLFLNSMAVVVDVFLRALFSAPIDRLSDVSSVVFFMATACCIPSATAERRHITIRALDKLRSVRQREAVEAFAAAVTAAVLGLIAWQAFSYAKEMALTGRTLSQIAVKVAPFWYFVAACMVASFLIAVFVFLRHVLAALGTTDADTLPPAGEVESIL